MAGPLQHDAGAREEIKRGLLKIAADAESYEDLRSQEEATNALGYLGFSDEFDVRMRLYEAFNSYFDNDRLGRIAAREKGQSCEVRQGPDPELAFLKSIVLRLFKGAEEPGLTLARKVSAALADTKYGVRLAIAAREATAAEKPSSN